MLGEGKDKLCFERTKMAVDAIKHVSTLATGSIVLIATLLDKFPKPLSERKCLIYAVGCMAMSLAASFIYLGARAILYYWVIDESERRMRRLNFIAKVACIAFPAGIGFLCCFIFSNIPK